MAILKHLLGDENVDAAYDQDTDTLTFKVQFNYDVDKKRATGV